MSGQIYPHLKNFCENLINGLPHSNPLLKRIIRQLAANGLNEIETTFFKLMNLLISSSSSGIGSKEEERINELIAQILQYLATSLGLQPPLNLLIERKFTKFYQFCNSQTFLRDARALLPRTQGLFPPNDANGNGSIFSFHSQHKKPYQGNPNWLYSRYLLSNWYKLKKSQLEKEVQQVYQFLLSQSTFFSESNALRRLWANLYTFYTQSILEKNLPTNGQIESRYITWKKYTEIQFLKQILNLQSSFTQQSKLLYFIICNLLDPFFNGMRKELKQLYQAFIPFNFKNLQLKLLANILFLEMCRTQKDQQLQKVIIGQGHKLMQFQVGDKSIYQLFLPFFLTSEEIALKIIQKQVSFVEIPLSTEKRNEVVISLYQNRKITIKQLPYLQNLHFLEMFSSNKWQQQNYANFVLGLMQDAPNIFIEKLMILSDQAEVNIAEKVFQSFLKAWSRYMTVIKLKQLLLDDLHRLNYAKKNLMQKNYHFMVIPQELPSTVQQILMVHCRFFNANKSCINLKGPINSFLSEFQEEILVELLPVLSQEQRSVFWKEWITIINGDNQFVAQILNAAEPANVI